MQQKLQKSKENYPEEQFIISPLWKEDGEAVSCNYSRSLVLCGGHLP